jgi:hypothetical protein
MVILLVLHHCRVSVSSDIDVYTCTLTPARQKLDSIDMRSHRPRMMGIRISTDMLGATPTLPSHPWSIFRPISRLKRVHSHARGVVVDVVPAKQIGESIDLEFIARRPAASGLCNRKGG